MASKATSDVAVVRPKTYFEILGLALGFLTLAALASPISQATLAPVFGAIPSAVNHKEAIVATSLLGFLLRAIFVRLPPGRVAEWTAVVAFWIPAIQSYLFTLSGTLGLVGGPAVIGFLSCHTLIIPSAYAAAEVLEDLDLMTRFGPILGTIVPAAAGVYHIVSFEKVFQGALPALTLVSSAFSPVSMQLLLGSIYTYLAPSKLAVLALPALLHTVLYNPHYDSSTTVSLLNDTLHQHNWSLIDRRWSITGYVSVLDSLNEQYRVMRCDHSLLGGEFFLTEERRKNEGWEVNEPIYAVFDMLEAVRLMELEPAIADADATALVIGLGIGTAPKAFITHGIDTTIVELDPVVHEYAITHFGLPTNHTAFIQGAAYWVKNATASSELKYDYIIHDVFTGGAEPISLFTDAFIQGLRSLLKPNGAIALNYAGGPDQPLTKKVLNTIDVTFEGQCKIYRDTPPETSETTDNKAEVSQDFSNMVVFCRNSPGPVSFRKPIAADYLGSKSRQQYMLPKLGLEIQFPRQSFNGWTQSDVLKEGDEGSWSAQQTESAIKHWYIMRKVLPDVVWELW